MTSENLTNILEHMERDVKWFFQDRAGAWGRPLPASVLSSRCDSSPVISKPLIIRILNRFWIGQLNTTTGLKPRREGSYLIRTLYGEDAEKP